MIGNVQLYFNKAHSGYDIIEKIDAFLALNKMDVSLYAVRSYENEDHYLVIITEL